jgi:hypothetical protein
MVLCFYMRAGTRTDEATLLRVPQDFESAYIKNSLLILRTMECSQNIWIYSCKMTVIYFYENFCYVGCVDASASVKTVLCTRQKLHREEY